jgi:hypothetical protein
MYFNISLKYAIYQDSISLDDTFSQFSRNGSKFVLIQTKLSH